ncbi:hypothetical protein MS3_00008868 [Schistosoma haematobium]|uniref:Uncharacterized protein n=2 Tax=Schistosoma haematobium TaxID=6185 RepID=A0A6A5DE54_SCHHA|nr:hypothetical protein MS3_00008868 [Schistosoma haematobium]KAH9581857.1 hypothetical protein MS3_00008868 [Schistosoma haematobium]
MTSIKYYDSDGIPELSPHHLGVYKEDQHEKNELQNNSMIELELARLRITQLEEEIELEKLRLQKCESFGQSISNSENTILKNLTIETVVLKLPTHIQQEWLKVAYKIIRGGREPLFTDLVEFVKEQAGIANTRYGLLVTGDPFNRNQRQSVADTKGHFDSGYKTRVSFANTNESDVTPYVRPRTLGLSCLLCTGNHLLDQCERFRDKNVNERIEFVSKKKLCNVCLKANHIARNCRAPRSCTVEGCDWRHHTLLHRKREEQGDNNNNAHINTQLCTEKSVERIQKQAAFAIVPVLLERLNLEGEPKTISLRTLDNQSTIQCKEVQLEVSSLDSSSSFRIPNVWTVERLPMLRRTVPTTSQMTSWTHLKDISFPRVKDENVKLLIGCNAPSVHEMKEIRTGKPNEPFAVKTLFGSYGEPCKSNRALNHLSAKEELEDKFEQLYSTEFKDPLSRTISLSVEDRIALSAISNSVQRLNGHYQIALPWRHKHKLPNNRELAERGLSCLKGRLIRDKKLFQD